MKSKARTHENHRGFTLIEMAIVVAIIAIMAATAFGVFLRFKQRNQVGQGIRHMFQIKKSLDSFARECGGYPIRTYGGPWNQLRVIINRQPPLFPFGLPQKYPSGAQCDAVSLQDYIASNMFKGTCDIQTAGCTEKIAKNHGANFGTLFVADSAGGGYAQDCNATDGSLDLGWNYVLLADPTQAFLKPIPVICANMLVQDSSSYDSMTVVINGSGVVGAVRTVDGAGMLGPDGGLLPDACTCGAWCEDHLHNRTGCCQTCTDAAGVTMDGMGFKY